MCDQASMAQRGRFERVRLGAGELHRRAGERERGRDVVVAVERGQQQPGRLVVARPAGVVLAHAVGLAEHAAHLHARVGDAARGERGGGQHLRPSS